jgi:hypothetical protein
LVTTILNRENKKGEMKSKKRWIDLSIINLCVVALLGIILRSKILFHLPEINYNNLLKAHSNFAFGGWMTLALIILMVNELLPGSLNKRPVYKWLFGGITLTAWGTLLNFTFGGHGVLSNFFSFSFIFVTYFFCWLFIKDIRKAEISKTVRLLTISAIASLILSSVGPISLAYLFASKSLNAILYRDALYTYLHLQYNGFFTLSVFALAFHKLGTNITVKSKRHIYLFSLLLSISIWPSLFLSFLWQDPNILFRIIAVGGSISLLLSLIEFIISALSLTKVYKSVTPIVWYMGLLSMTAFILKMFFQSLTIFPFIGNSIFGDRPVIIGFLHLVFLGFVSLFILAYFAQNGLLNIKYRFTRLALLLFTLGIVFNEVILMGQGRGSIFIRSRYLFPWLLWAISIWLFIGALLIAIARFKYNAISSK